jgi:hypothetical protein
MKTAAVQQPPLPGSVALPFVISTGAPKERSGEICVPFLEMFFLQGEDSFVGRDWESSQLPKETTFS